MNIEPQSQHQQTQELLQRILNAVEHKKNPRRGFEIICAILLSLATTGSAWCAYQSKLWGGAQMARANVAVTASREEAVSALAALQTRTFDASMFISYMEARVGKNEK